MKKCIIIIIHTVLSVNSLADQSTKNRFDELFTTACEQAYTQNIAEAQKTFEQALMLEPHHPQALFNSGLLCYIQRQFTQAHQYLTHALAVDPLYTKAYEYLAATYEELCSWDMARCTYEHLLVSNPHNKQFLQHHAHCAIRCRHYEQACTSQKKLIELDPHNLTLLCDAATVAKKLHLFTLAQNYYETALNLDPHHARAHRGLAHILLAQGLYERGWQEYEWRWIPLQHNAYLLKKYIADHGSLDGIRILLKTEYGFGDTLQFIRYAQELKKRGAWIIVSSHPALVSLLQQCPYIDELYDQSQPMPHHHIDLFVMSLPLVCDTTATTIPATIPYIYADKTLVATWQEHIDKRYYNIGICWQADMSSTDETIIQDAQEKSVPLSLLSTLTSLPYVRLYSLQKHIDQTTINNVHDMGIYTFEHFDEKSGCFMDTAAIMELLDLVISIDTSITHLAGALGRPTVTLLPHSSDWRWLVETSSSAWYPTMHLIRQPRQGDWHNVMAATTVYVADLVDKKYSFFSQHAQ